MGIGQFLVIFWARRILIVAAAASCLVGALIVTAVLPPRWESTARVMLDTIKPDPITGQVMGAAGRVYVATQLGLITDYSVASRVAEQIGWLTDPNLIAAYRARPADDQRDYRRWLADIVIANTKAKLIQDSNIVEISYASVSATGAKAGADAVVKAYLQAVLDSRHEYAEKNAAWYADQMEKTRRALDEAVEAESAYEKQNGVIMQGDKTDADNARLQTLAVQGTPIVQPMTPTAGTGANAELAAVDAQLEAGQKIFGPNNPQIVALKARRAALAALAQREEAAAREADARIGVGAAQALAKEVSEQKAKVIANSEKVGRLTQLHENVEQRRDEFNRAAAKLADFRQQAESADVGVTPLGPAATPKAPVFPNYPLIVVGSIVMGLGVGVGVSLLMELLARKVRTTGDLSFDHDVPMVCLVPDVEAKKSRPAGGRRRFGARAPGAVTA
jgi:uncharacterized protein involved in exopolysaccharide biosynthesis